MTIVSSRIMFEAVRILEQIANKCQDQTNLNFNNLSYENFLRKTT